MVQTATPAGEVELDLSPDRPCSLALMFGAASACSFEELPPMGRNRQSHVEFDRAAPRREGPAYPNFTCNRAGRHRPGADFDGPAAVAADQPPGCASVVVTGGLGGGGVGVSSRIRWTCANILRVIFFFFAMSMYNTGLVYQVRKMQDNGLDGDETTRRR